MVNGVDALTGQTVVIDADMAVLALWLQELDDAVALKESLTSVQIQTISLQRHPKLKPVETASAGIYLAGACQGPKRYSWNSSTGTG